MLKVMDVDGNLAITYLFKGKVIPILPLHIGPIAEQVETQGVEVATAVDLCMGEEAFSRGPEMVKFYFDELRKGYELTHIAELKAWGQAYMPDEKTVQEIVAHIAEVPEATYGFQQK